MTRGRMIARVAAELGLSVTGEELTMLQEWANEGVVDVLVQTRCHVEVGSATLTVGEGTYDLDTDILAVEEQTFSIPVQILSPNDLLLLPTQGGDGVRYVAFDGDKMLVYPLPTTAETVSWLYVPRPSPMTDDSNDPSTTSYGGIPTEYHQAIMDFMLREASRYDGSAAPMAPKDYAQRYEDSIKLVRKNMRRRHGRRLAASVAGYPWRTRPSGRNDTYPRF